LQTKQKKEKKEVSRSDEKVPPRRQLQLEVEFCGDNLDESGLKKESVTN